MVYTLRPGSLRVPKYVEPDEYGYDNYTDFNGTTLDPDMYATILYENNTDMDNILTFTQDPFNDYEEDKEVNEEPPPKRKSTVHVPPVTPGSSVLKEYKRSISELPVTLLQEASLDLKSKSIVETTTEQSKETISKLTTTTVRNSDIVQSKDEGLPVEMLETTDPSVTTHHISGSYDPNVLMAVTYVSPAPANLGAKGKKRYNKYKTTKASTLEPSTTTPAPTLEEIEIIKELNVNRLWRYENIFDAARMGGELFLVVGSVLYLLGALREMKFLGRKLWWDSLVSYKK